MCRDSRSLFGWLLYECWFYCSAKCFYLTISSSQYDLLKLGVKKIILPRSSKAFSGKELHLVGEWFKKIFKFKRSILPYRSYEINLLTEIHFARILLFLWSDVVGVIKNKAKAFRMMGNKFLSSIPYNTCPDYEYICLAGWSWLGVKSEDLSWHIPGHLLSRQMMRKHWSKLYIYY